MKEVETNYSFTSKLTDYLVDGSFVGKFKCKKDYRNISQDFNQQEFIIIRHINGWMVSLIKHMLLQVIKLMPQKVL